MSFINFTIGLKQIVTAKELIAHHDNQIAEYHVLLAVAIHFSKTTRDSAARVAATARKFGDEVEPSSLGDAEDKSDNDQFFSLVFCFSLRCYLLLVFAILFYDPLVIF